MTPTSTPTDEALVALAKGGDRGAFSALMVRYQDRIYRVALRLSGDEHDAEDIVQDAFLQAWRKIGGFRGDARFSTWLYRVATNVALMKRRTERRRVQSESLEACLPRFDENGRHLRVDVDYSAAARVEAIVEHQELRRQVRAALSRIPRIYRVAFVLCDLEDLTAQEAGDIVGADAATIRQRVHRARLMLRGHLGRLAGSEGP